MATENILMHAVTLGGDRQELHEAIRQHSQAAAAKVKLEGGANDLLDRLLGDPAFHLTRDDLDNVLDVRKFVGLAPEQTDRFLAERDEGSAQRMEPSSKTRATAGRDFPSAFTTTR